MDQYSTLTFTNTTVVQQKNSLILFITILVFLVIFEMITLAEGVIAFIRNSHILGFCLAAVLFILNTTTAILMSGWFKRGIFVKSRRKLILCLTGFCGLLLWLVICFLAIKIVNFSQKSEDLADLGYRDRFTDEGTEQAQAGSKTTIQSRVQYTAVIKLNDRLTWKGDSFYIHTSHTDLFFGLITDGIYIIEPLSEKLLKTDSEVRGTGQDPFVDVCTYVTCTYHIGDLLIEGNKYESEYEVFCIQNISIFIFNSEFNSTSNFIFR